MKIHPVEAELFHADRWTDGHTWHDEANSRFSQILREYLKVSEGRMKYI